MNELKRGTRCSTPFNHHTNTIQPISYLAAMAKTYRRITKIVFLVLNILASVAFLLACLAPSLDPVRWWYVSMLGLGFGFIVITLISFIFFWLVFKPYYVLISLLPMLVGF